jgi:hypothetical protein
MIADVQLWVNSPESNFGWILLGPQDPFVKSAKRFSSRESDFNPPALVVTYAEGFGLWASYPVNEDGRSVFTNGFLGWIDISSAPWICWVWIGQ